jgi:hypothetical protein
LEEHLRAGKHSRLSGGNHARAGNGKRIKAEESTADEKKFFCLDSFAKRETIYETMDSFASGRPDAVVYFNQRTAAAHHRRFV